MVWNLVVIDMFIIGVIFIDWFIFYVKNVVLGGFFIIRD